MSAPTRMTLEEWRKRGTELFGEDQMKWKFRCPSCGHVQAVEDFKPFKPQGATAQTASQQCIGRFMGAKGAFSPAEFKPCNYAIFGLFRLEHIEVMLDGDPDPHPVFHFAEATS